MKSILFVISLLLLKLNSFGQDKLLQLKTIELAIQSPEWQLAFFTPNPMPQDLGKVIDEWKSVSEALSIQIGKDPLYAGINQIVKSIKEKLNSFKGKNKSNDTDVKTYSEIRGLFLQFDYARTILSIDLILKSVEVNLNQQVVKLDKELSSQISNVKGLITRLDGRIETLKKDIVWENKATVMPNFALINLKLDNISRQQTSIQHSISGQGTWYAGAMIYTGQSVGFSVQHLVPSNQTLKLLLGADFLYRKIESDEQPGIGIALGPSFRLRDTYRLGALGEVARIGNQNNYGGRLMAYNRFMAVGVGYSNLLGTGVSLLICLK